MLRGEAVLQEQWHHVAGRPVRSLTCGRPRSGVPELVVLPGLGALGYLLPTVLACGAWTRVWLLDLPGFGSARTSRQSAELSAVSQVSSQWLAQAVTAPVVLLGHSTGAQVALRATVDRPAAVRLLVLAGATFDPPARHPRVLARRVLGTVRHERAGELPAVLPYYLRGARGMPVLLRSAMVDRPEDRIGQVECPVLVLRGARDGLCPADWARALAGGAKDGRALQLPGAHNVPYTHPELLSAVLAQAAAGVGAAQPGPS